MIHNKKNEALRIAYQAFIKLHAGATFTADEYMIFANLCALALPMRHRFTREELRNMGHPKYQEIATQ